MSILDAIIIAVVEGITEFLPISSTGHMIITQKLLRVEASEFTRMFTVGIQLGAILAVLVLYWKKFVAPLRGGNWNFYGKLIVAVVPALVLGFIFSDAIDELLDSALVVALTMIAGGFILLVIDRYFRKETIQTEEQVSYLNALLIGFWQCIAMIPGVSRSAASIIGGMQQNLSRKLAAEFSFFLAVPTMAAATGYKLYKGYDTISSGDIKLFIVGNAVAFIVAVLAIRFFIGFLQKHGFRLFGYYRIIGGIILLVLILAGVIKR